MSQSLIHETITINDKLELLQKFNENIRGAMKNDESYHIPCIKVPTVGGPMWICAKYPLGVMETYDWLDAQYGRQRIWRPMPEIKVLPARPVYHRFFNHTDLPKDAAFM